MVTESFWLENKFVSENLVKSATRDNAKGKQDNARISTSIPHSIRREEWPENACN